MNASSVSSNFLCSDATGAPIGRSSATRPSSVYDSSTIMYIMSVYVIVAGIEYIASVFTGWFATSPPSVASISIGTAIFVYSVSSPIVLLLGSSSGSDRAMYIIAPIVVIVYIILSYVSSWFSVSVVCVHVSGYFIVSCMSCVMRCVIILFHLKFFYFLCYSIVVRDI